MSSPPASYRAIICVDIERFCDPERIDPQRLDMRRALYDSLARAFERSGVPAEGRYQEDRGDGAFFLVPPEGPQARLVEPLPFELAAELSRYNRAADAMTRIRLRVALHAGYVHHDSEGVVGTPLNAAFRLLDAPELKKALRDAPGDLAFIASDEFHREVIRQRRGFDPSDYREVRVRAKETDVGAWICAFDAQLRAGRDFGHRLARAEDALAALAATVDEARRVRAVTVAKITPAPPEVPDPAPGLGERLAGLRGGRKDRWPELAAEVAEVERAAAAALDAAGAALRAAREPLERREELRGLLGSYQAMTGNQKRAESPLLDELYRRAYDLLWTAPCSLPEAEAATERYVRAVQEESA